MMLGNNSGTAAMLGNNGGAGSIMLNTTNINRSASASSCASVLSPACGANGGLNSDCGGGRNVNNNASMLGGSPLGLATQQSNSLGAHGGDVAGNNGGNFEKSWVLR